MCVREINVERKREREREREREKEREGHNGSQIHFSVFEEKLRMMA